MTRPPTSRPATSARGARHDAPATDSEPTGPRMTRSDAKPILEVENLQKYFPVKSGGLIRRTVGHVQAVDGVSFQVRRVAPSAWWASRAAASRPPAG